MRLRSSLSLTHYILLGLVAAHWAKPGMGGIPMTASAPPSTPPAPASMTSFLENLIPTSIVQVMFSNNLLGLVFFTVLFALALRASGAAGDPIYRACSSLATIMFRLTGYVMWAAPFGVLGGMASIVSHSQRAMRAPPPRITCSTSWRVTMVVSPGVVMARVPCAAPHSTAHCAPFPDRKP